MRLRSLFAILSTLFAAFFGHTSAAATLTLPYQARTYTYSVDLTAGQTRSLTFVFTNIGSETWKSSKTGAALYLYGTSSIFGHPSWLADDMPTLLNEASVKPSSRATVTFSVKAPVTPGTYRERFLLSYAPNRWIKGSVVSITFNVKASTTSPPAPIVAPAPAPAPVATPAVATPLQISNEWKAELVDRGGIEWQIDPLDHVTVNVAFKNVGTATWTKDGKNYISIYTGTTGRKSVFKDSAWKSETQPVLLKETSVRPGDVGHFTFDLRAPEKSGTYTEAFQLAAENKAWISGGTVSFPIRVTAPIGFLAKGVENGVDPAIVEQGASPSGIYKGLLLLTSTRNVTLLGNGRQTLTYGFKNAGTATWNALSLRVTGVAPALSGLLSSVRDESWVTATEAASAIKDTPPGQIGFIGFTLKAPAKKGTYTASFRLYANGQPVEDGVIEIPITVTADGYIAPEPQPSTAPGTVTAPSVPAFGDPASLPAEPIIRVGLFRTTDDAMVVRAVSGGFLLQENGNVVCRFEAGESVRVTYDRAGVISRASGPRCATQTTGVYVAVATDGLSPLELTDYNRPVSWLPGANDNKFRGKLELRYTKPTDSVWIINELPVEWYLKGIAETSNSSPQEYQRALLTAARTYAMYHVQRGSKHADENYTVDAKYDQVYRGYGAEVRDPAVVSAVDATRGQIVMYQGKLAITPYYSRSDGRTRSWTEVWGGGPYAWLVSVSVPWDNGRTLWGHGVGMSATGALGMAADGWTYDKILTYFYTGTELRRIYK